MMLSVEEGARKILKQLVAADPHHLVSIVADAELPSIVSDALLSAANEIGCSTVKLVFDASKNNGKLPKQIDEVMAMSDIVLCVTAKTLGYSDGANRCRAKGGRVIALTEANENTLTTGGIEADFFLLQETITRVRKRFDAASDVRVTAPGGTELTLNIEGRRASASPGLCLEPGLLAAIPAVEVYIPPNEGMTQGRFVADVSASRLGLLKEPICMEIRNGTAVSIEGGEQAERIKKVLHDTHCPASYVVAEFAIGLNPCGKLIGIISSDEGLYGTGHFALGQNIGMGGGNNSPEHLDFVYRRPTIYLDNDLFMKDGELTDQ